MKIGVQTIQPRVGVGIGVGLESETTTTDVDGSDGNILAGGGVAGTGVVGFGGEFPI
jgi:hypothetical protein